MLLSICYVTLEVTLIWTPETLHGVMVTVCAPCVTPLWRCGACLLRLEVCFVALHNEWCSLSNKRVFESSFYLFSMLSLLRVSTSESMIPRPCFEHWYTVYNLFCYMFACYHCYYRLLLPPAIIYITCILLSLRRTSASIHLTSVLGVLGTQETSCILIAWLLERDVFDLYLPEFDIPWVIHLRETCWCSTNLCSWRPNTVYENRSVCRHQCPHVLFYTQLHSVIWCLRMLLFL